MAANRLGTIEFHFFFGMLIKTLGSLAKIRVGRVTGNTYISFFGLKALLIALFYCCTIVQKELSALLSCSNKQPSV